MVAFLGHVKAIHAGADQIRVESRFPKTLAQVLAGFDLIFDDQYLHGILLDSDVAASVPADPLPFFNITKM